MSRRKVTLCLHNGIFLETFSQRRSSSNADPRASVRRFPVYSRDYALRTATVENTSLRFIKKKKKSFHGIQVKNTLRWRRTPRLRRIRFTSSVNPALVQRMKFERRVASRKTNRVAESVVLQADGQFDGDADGLMNRGLESKLSITYTLPITTGCRRVAGRGRVVRTCTSPLFISLPLSLFRLSSFSFPCIIPSPPPPAFVGHLPCLFSFSLECHSQQLTTHSVS